MRYRIKGRQYNSRNCFVCGVENDFGLHADFFETENNELIVIAQPGEKHQSYPGRMHGGIASALLDEAIGRSVSALHGHNIWGITLELSLKYRKPVPYGCELKVVARVTEDHPRWFEGTGELILPGGEVAVTANGRYMKQPAEKITDPEFEDSEWGFIKDISCPKEIDV